MFYGAPPHIFEKARELRKRMTPAEQKLWERLKKKQINGNRFRRQHPISNFIADFYCHSAKLIIEVDGGIHSIEEQKEYDVQRSEKLNRLGVAVIRFTNKEIEEQLETVIADIAARLS